MVFQVMNSQLSSLGSTMLISPTGSRTFCVLAHSLRPSRRRMILR